MHIKSLKLLSIIESDLMKCDGCRAKVDSTTTSTCLTSHVDLSDYNLDDKISCPDDYFYCKDCVNDKGFCKDCASRINKEDQLRIYKDFK